MKKVLIMLVVCVSAVLATDRWAIRGIDGTDYATLDKSGNLTVAGTFTPSGDVVVSNLDVDTIDLGNANIDYDTSNYEVDIDTTIHSSAPVMLIAVSGGAVTSAAPSATGIFAFDSNWVLYVSTGTANSGQWYKIGSQ